MIVLDWEKEGVDFWKNNRANAAVRRALRMAGSSAVKAMRAASSREIRAKKKFKVAAVNKALKLVYPPASATIDGMEWRLNATAMTTPVSAFSFRQTAKGVTARINKGKLSKIPSAFVLRLDSGHVGVFVREGKGRLPIKEAFTTKITDVFRDNGMTDGVERRAIEVFNSAFSRLLALELKK
jgi:hypothetical protein